MEFYDNMMQYKNGSEDQFPTTMGNRRQHYRVKNKGQHQASIKRGHQNRPAYNILRALCVMYMVSDLTYLYVSVWSTR